MPTVVGTATGGGGAAVWHSKLDEGGRVHARPNQSAVPWTVRCSWFSVMTWCSWFSPTMSCYLTA